MTAELRHIATAASSLDDEFARLDERALMFDPDAAYRAEVKERLTRRERAETALARTPTPFALVASLVAGAVLVVGLIEKVPY